MMAENLPVAGLQFASHTSTMLKIDFHHFFCSVGSVCSSVRQTLKFGKRAYSYQIAVVLSSDRFDRRFPPIENLIDSVESRFPIKMSFVKNLKEREREVLHKAVTLKKP